MAPSNTEPPFVIISPGGRSEGGGVRRARDDRDRGRGSKTVDDYDDDSNNRPRWSVGDGPFYAPSNSVSQRVDRNGNPDFPTMEGSDIYLAPNSNGNEKPANGSSSNGPVVIVRGEEIGIVVVVLLLWVGAIVLFFNRWGKIRMLEPYQPKFCESHRPSCPMAEVTTAQTYPRTYSKFNISTELMGSPHFAKCNYHGIPGISGYGAGLGPSLGGNRPRQNSVFVTSPHTAAMAMAINSSNLKSASRKTKSAIDLSTLVLSEQFLENVRRNSKNSITHL